MKKVLVCCEVEPHLKDIFAEFEKKFDVRHRSFRNRSDILSAIGDVDIVVTDVRQVVDRGMIDAATRLEVIATPTTGTDHIDLEYARTKGVEVLSLKHDYDFLKTITATAEHAFLLMLASLRRLTASFDSVRNGEWERERFIGRELRGMKVGVVGFGRLGEIFARLALGFDMDVYACDPRKTITQPDVTQMEFAELAGTVDAISLHVHLSDETRNMIGEKEFAMMRDGVCLVNTSRGGLIDERAFVRALESGKVKYAGVDVLATELEGGISENPLVKYAKTHDNLIITPHIGGCAYESQRKAFKRVLDKLEPFRTG